MEKNVILGKSQYSFYKVKDSLIFWCSLKSRSIETWKISLVRFSKSIWQSPFSSAQYRNEVAIKFLAF